MFRSVKLQPKIGAKALVHMLTAAKAPAEVRNMGAQCLQWQALEEDYNDRQ